MSSQSPSCFHVCARPPLTRHTLVLALRRNLDVNQEWVQRDWASSNPSSSREAVVIWAGDATCANDPPNPATLAVASRWLRGKDVKPFTRFHWEENFPTVCRSAWPSCLLRCAASHTHKKESPYSQGNGEIFPALAWGLLRKSASSWPGIALSDKQASALHDFQLASFPVGKQPPHQKVTAPCTQEGTASTFSCITFSVSSSQTKRIWGPSPPKKSWEEWLLGST